MHRTFTDAGRADWSAGMQGLDPIDDADDVGARLALDVDDDRGRSFIQAACFTFSAPVDDVGDVAEADRGARRGRPR